MNFSSEAIDQNMSNGHYQPSMVNGLVWRDEWGMPFEGPLTLLWKIAIANALTPQELCNFLFHKKLLPQNADGVHGRSLLVTRWMLDSNGEISRLGDVTRHGGLDVFSARWATILASDSRIRYCELCMAEGYQSVFCQIDGLLRCPTHGVLLLDNCKSCGSLTPRYALSTLTMSSPFCCHSCGKLYGGVGPSLSSLKFYNSEAAQVNKYDILNQWFLSLGKLELFWPQLLSWQCCNEGKSGDKERRTAIFGVLNHLIPVSDNPDYVEEPPNRISIFQANLVTRSVSAPLQKSRMWNEELGQRTILYLAIRRRVRRMLKRHHRHCLKSSSSSLHVEWCNEVLYSSERICPLAFGYQLWRHHFEIDITLDPREHQKPNGIKLRKEILAWPVDFEVNTKAWGIFTLMSFFSYLQVAFNWCERTSALNKLDNNSNRADFMEVLSEFRVSLSPSYMAWPPRITYFEVKNIFSDDMNMLIIAGPIGKWYDILSKYAECSAYLKCFSE